MVEVTLRRMEDDWVIVLPEIEIERLGLNDGQHVNVEITSTNTSAERRQHIDAIMDDVVVEYREAFEYLAK